MKLKSIIFVVFLITILLVISACKTQNQTDKNDNQNPNENQDSTINKDPYSQDNSAAIAEGKIDPRAYDGPVPSDTNQVVNASDLSDKESLAEDPEPIVLDSKPSWFKEKFKDVRTGKMFSVSDFKGKPVLLESFAVWCPLCTKQQEELKKLHAEVGDAIISISINTDSNEDEKKVLDHVKKNGFDWFYAVSPEEVTQSLIDEFGPGIIHAPSVPKILVCPDQTYKKLPSGIKPADSLKQTIASEC
jgi:thiol-disulfide isomerase/thioredoxin